MRIAFVTFEYPPFIIGGAGVYALKVTHELAKLGHFINVFVPNIPGIEYENDLENIVFNKVEINNKLPFTALQFWLNLPVEVKKIESECKFDIIHFNGISYWFLKRRISKAPHIVTIHHLVKDSITSNKSGVVSRIKNISGENSFFIPFVEKKCIKSPDKIIAVSNYTKNQVINTYDTDPNNICTIYNGIDLYGYDFSEEEILKTKKQFNLDNATTLLFVGRVNDPRKGLSFLLYSLRQVLNNFNVNLIIVGKGDQTEARKLSEFLGISNNVLFTGFVNENDLKKYYSLCDIYVCPSKLEGFGLTILEAMAASKPIVATNVGAIPEIIENRVNGILVESENIDHMTNAICTFIQNINFAKDIGKFNERQVVQKFSWNKCARDVSSFYERVYCDVQIHRNIKC